MIVGTSIKPSTRNQARVSPQRRVRQVRGPLPSVRPIQSRLKATGNSKNKQNKRLPKSAPDPRPKALTVAEDAAARLAKSPAENESGKVLIKFNHYNKAFPVHNSVVKWADVDAEYALSFVYRGDFRRDLFETQKVMDWNKRVFARRDDAGSFFLVKLGQNYTLDVEEDPVAGIGAEGLRLNDKPLRAKHAMMSTNPSKLVVKDITEELKSLDPAKLSTEAAKLLLEQRDVEDILYS